MEPNSASPGQPGNGSVPFDPQGLNQRQTLVRKPASLLPPQRPGVPGWVIALIVTCCIGLFVLVPIIVPLVANSAVNEMRTSPDIVMASPKFTWDVPATGATPRSSSSAMPNMKGTWVGAMHPGSQRIVLVITSQSGRHFSGEIAFVTGTPFELQEEGTVSPDNQTLELRDTSILYAPTGEIWDLDTCDGGMSYDGLSMAGVGDDTGGNRFAWAFTKQSNQPATVRLVE